MTNLPMSSDAAMVLGLAGTALPFAQSPDDEVERWLRPLRLYGESAAVLNALAIGEAPLAEVSEHADEPERTADDVLSSVSSTASNFAAQRGVPVVGTVDVLVAVMREYPDAFERALQSRGSDTAELVEQLAGRLHMAIH
jgi:hypothetical protein